MYYDYYIGGRSSALPPRRQACLLRYGIDAAREEIQRLGTHIHAQELVLQETMSKRYLTLSNTAIATLPSPYLSHINKKGVQQNDIKIEVDLGQEGSWESLLNTCITERFLDHEYEFCFFGQITQDKAHSLGRFAHWGQSQSGVYGVDMDVTGTGGSLQRHSSYSEQYGRETQYTASPAATDAVPAAEGGEGVGEDQGPTAGALVNAYLAALSAHPAVAAVIDTVHWMGLTLLDQLNMVFVYLMQHNRITGLTPTGDRLLTSLYSGFNSLRQALTGQHPVGTEPNILNTGFFHPKVLKMEGFKGSAEDTQEYYSTQVYADGERCVPGHGLPRYSVVYFECGTATKLLDVVETQMCEYRVTVSTPLACTAHLEARSLDRLDSLGVFGFSKSASSSSGRRKG